MVPNRICFLVLLVFLCLSSTPDASLQNKQSNGEGAQQQAPDFREKIRVRSDLVLLSVTVRDGNGNLVSGLKQGDFRVFDDEVEQRITAFIDEGLSISLIILVDSDTKWKDGTPMAKSLGAIAGGLSVADEAMVCRYDMHFYPGEKFTSVSDNLIDELKTTQAAVAPPPPYIPEPLITDSAATGGDIVYARKSSTMENLYSRITEQARHAYTFAYAPTGNLKDSDFHAVRVTATAGLTASTRRGYYTITSD